MKTVVQVVLIIAIVVLGYLLLESIQKPQRFNKEKDIRWNKCVERLVDIRTAQLAFKTEYGRFTSDFDSLIHFVKNDSFKVIRAIGDISDSLLNAGWNERRALREGIIIRDTILISVLDSIFYLGYPIDSIKYVPFTDNAIFELGAGVLETGSKVKIFVFEASVLNNILLHGMDRQLVLNFNAEREKITQFPGLKVGSLTEATNNAGNWE